MKPIKEIANAYDIPEIEPYGHNMAKVPYHAITDGPKKNSTLILVSAMTPTPAGEGKTTTSIGLAQGLKELKKNVALALREPSMGPLFGMKGGACGGGRSQVMPVENINLHFTGDFAAITAAHNLLAAALDNALHFREIPDLDARRITFPRVLDVNDRSLRDITVGLGGPTMGVPRQARFDITAASEIMAILCLSSDYDDLKRRLGNIVLGYTYKKTPVFARELDVVDALCAVLKDALHPNLVQTTEGVAAFVHGGPFANIAHGSNSILATRMALAYADYAITEAGFAFDLGGEKFFDITARIGDFFPSVVVLVCTLRALKLHGGVELSQRTKPDKKALSLGLTNLEQHLESVAKFGVPAVVAINVFPEDQEDELKFVVKELEHRGVRASPSWHFAEGGKGALQLANTVLDALAGKPRTTHLYPTDMPLKEKIETIATTMYGASKVEYTVKAQHDIDGIEETWNNLDRHDSGPLVCMAKTPMSLSDDPNLRGRPRGHILHIREVQLAAGAGFVVPLSGEIIRMPGLAKEANYKRIRFSADGKISGLT